MIYLDNASTTQVSNHVFDAMRPYFMEKYGNPGNLHSMGLEAASAVEKARAQVAAPIHADPSEIIFTSGGSEANSLAITGLLDHLSNIGRTHIVVSNVEHGSVLTATKSAFYKGFEVTYVPVDPATGCIKPQSVIDAMRDNTGLVSVMCVNNEIGTVNPIDEIGCIAHKHGALFHTDCVQAYCHRKIDVNKQFIDFLSASGHKIHAPKGIGIIGVCDGDCVNCEDPSLCDDSMDIGELLDGEREVDLYEVIAKALSLTALFFSAATAIKAWKKIR